VLNEMLTADLVDEACVFVAPRLVGRRRAGSSGSVGQDTCITAAARPCSVHFCRSGDDLLCRLRIHNPPVR